MPLYHIGVEYESEKGHGDVLIDVFLWLPRKASRQRIETIFREGVSAGGEDMPTGAVFTAVSWGNPQRREFEWKGDGDPRLDVDVRERSESGHTLDLQRFDAVVRSALKLKIADVDLDEDMERET